MLTTQQYKDPFATLADNYETRIDANKFITLNISLNKIFNIENLTLLLSLVHRKPSAIDATWQSWLCSAETYWSVKYLYGLWLMSDLSDVCENWVSFNLIGLFYYTIFSLRQWTHFGLAAIIAGKWRNCFSSACTVYEFGHSFNCGSASKNEDKFFVCGRDDCGRHESKCTSIKTNVMNRVFLRWCACHR